MELKIPLNFEIGQKVDMGDRIGTIIGVEHVPGRSLRYVILVKDGFDVKWIYLHDFELKILGKES